MSKEFELFVDELNLLDDFIPKDGVLILIGNLASGKTTLVKHIVASRGINADVTSPTFSIMHQYKNIFHYDLYMKDMGEIMKNGLFENFFEDGLHLVEWGDDKLANLLKKYGLSPIIVEISTPSNTKKRKYRILDA